MVRFIYIILISILLFFLQSCMVSQSKVHIDFLNTKEIKKDATFMSVDVPMFLTKRLFINAIKNENDSKELIKIIRKTKDVKILVIEKSNADVKTKVKDYFNKKNYQEWFSINQAGQIISINAEQTDKKIKRLIFCVVDGKESIYIDVKGKYTLEDISELINATERNKIKINKELIKTI